MARKKRPRLRPAEVQAQRSRALQEGRAAPGGRNKAPDLLSDAEARLRGWLGPHYERPAGPPFPWDGLLPDERELFDRAVRRLVYGLVPRDVAEAVCWSGGAWRAPCQKIVDAADVEVYPARHHIRLIPRPTARELLGLPAVAPHELN